MLPLMYYIIIIFYIILQMMSYSGFIYEEAGIPRDAIPYVIVGQVSYL